MNTPYCTRPLKSQQPPLENVKDWWAVVDEHGNTIAYAKTAQMADIACESLHQAETYGILD